MKLLLLLTFLLSSSAFAAGKNIWRDCGIGALVFTETKWAAVTSNITWDLGLTASTSTSSSPDQCAGVGANSAKYIFQNYALLEEETIKEQGLHIAAVLDILSCQKSSRQHIIQKVKSNLVNDISNQKSDVTLMQKAQNYHNNLMNTIQTSYSDSCQLI